MTDRATEYAEKVVSGEIPMGRLVRLACERHLRDLKRDDLVWDPGAVERVDDFFREVLVVDDRRADSAGGSIPFELSPHQIFYVGSIYGWKRPDTGHLRFKVIYIEVSRGDGKTPVAGGIGLRGLCFEGVRGAQIYAAGSVKDQAMLLFRDAVSMAMSSPELEKRIKFSGKFPQTWSMAHVESLSYFRAISSEDGKAGARVYRALLDEIHEHSTPYIWDLMTTGMKGIPNSFLLAITNSGWDRTSVCWREHEYTRRVLEGQIEDDARFGFITGLDPCATHRKEGREFPVEDCPECDDWTNESVWPKACPNLGVTITWDYLRELVTEAKGKPSQRNVIKRLNFNIWTEQLETWLPIEDWQACARPDVVTPELLRGRRCIAGGDFAYSDDTTALVLLFPPIEEDEPWKWLEWYWIPRDIMPIREKEHRVPYSTWVEDGWIEATPGVVTDYAYVRQKLGELSRVYEIERLPIDPTHAVQLSTQLLEDGLPVELFPQGCRKYSPAMKETERLIASRQIAHRGHPVTMWQAGNVAPYENRAGERKPDKKRSRGKIDGIVALLMALAMATETPEWTMSDAGIVVL